MSHRHRVVYIAGPFRGPDHWAVHEHVLEAERLALQVWQAGATALCPHLNTRHFQGVLPDHVWLHGDLELLRRCDAVLLAPGWHESEGATTEYKAACAKNLPIFHSVVELARWLGAHE